MDVMKVVLGWRQSCFRAILRCTYNRRCSMADAMVTARMSQEKKEAGNRVLEQLGTNASQAVNRLYDYVLEKRQLPFPE